MAENNTPFEEIGVTGTNIFDGRSYDEYQVELRGERGMRTYREMRDQDSINGAVLTAITNLIRAATFSTQPADSSEEAKDAAGFLVDVLESMDNYTWDDLLTEATSMFVFGFADHEVIYKRRDDGNIGIKRLGIRVQETVDKYELDNNNNVVGLWQQPNTGGYFFIPEDRLVHWQTTNARGNPYGRSLLRNAYRSWYYKKSIEETEAIGIERELTGVPIVRIPNDIMVAANNGDSDAAATVDQYRKIARDMRFNSQSGVILPSDPYINSNDSALQYSNNRKVDIELIASQGTRNIDTSAVIKRYASDQARSTLSDFILLGSDTRGSYALSQSKSDLFTQSLKAHSNRIAETLNRQLVPKLWRLNGFDPALMPKIVVSQLAPMDLESLGSYIKNLSGAGVMITDEEAQQWLKTQAGIPTDNENEPDISDQGDDQVEDQE